MSMLTSLTLPHAPSPSTLLVVDLGNTRTKVALFEGDKIVQQNSFLTHDEAHYQTLIPWLKKEHLLLTSTTHIALSSVVPSRTSSWQMASQQLEIPLFSLSGLKACRHISFTIEEPDKIGADRIAGLLGGQKRYPQENLIIIDMGTAITLNVLTKTGLYLGGAILTGLQKAFSSLIQATALLPEMSLTPGPIKIGQTTHEQLDLMIPFYLAGLKELVSKMAVEGFGDAASYKIIGTGGDAFLLKEAGLFNVIDQDLKLLGVWQAFLDHLAFEAAAENF